MDRGSAESPIDRVGRFVTNIGRGSLDVGKSYTTDIVDTVGSAVTGSDSEVATRSIKERTLLDAYVTSAFEGNLNPAFQETGRRVLMISATAVLPSPDSTHFLIAIPSCSFVPLPISGTKHNVLQQLCCRCCSMQQVV